MRRRSLATKSGILAEETVIVLATASELAALHAALDRFWACVDGALPDPPDMRWRLELATAIAEIGANIVQHAYPAGAAGHMELRLRLYRDRIETRLADQGITYRPAASQPAPYDDLLALPEGGFGLGIARAAVDWLAYRRTRAGTNCWRLIKRF